jgi:hypothetical protein
MSEMLHTELGLLIDAVYNLRAERLELARKVDALKNEEVQQKTRIMEILQSYGLAKASGQVATAGQVHKIEPTVVDWEALHGYIRENNRFDLLQKRISSPAWRELQDEGTLVPGTEPTEVWDLSLTKSTRG